MNVITHCKLLAAFTALSLIMAPDCSFARVNSLTGGLSTGLDLDYRSYDNRDDDSRSIVISPLVQFRSLSERDSFELRAVPGLRYDLIDSETDWDASLGVAADRFMTQFWQLGISNEYVRSNSYDTDTGVLIDPAVPPQDVPSTTSPELSSDRGRSLYWRNSLSLFSSYFYREDSLIRLDSSYTALRNEDTSFGGDEDYDRYTVGLRNEHRYNAKWKTSADLLFVRGDFEPTDPAVGSIPTVAPLSEDLDEYHLSLVLENNSIVRNPLSVSYSYLGTKYDEVLQDDSDIHQMRVSWRRDISPRMYTNLGAGPTYVKTEEQDDTWGGNGIAEVNYAVEHGFFNFLVEKTYDVDNFSGTSESGVVDLWETRFSGSYQLQSDLTLSGRLSYAYEDREELMAISGGGGTTQLEKYHNDRYSAGVGLNYNFWQFYTARVDYTFTTLNSDRIGDDYDDHRILLTLSWKKELFHW